MAKFTSWSFSRYSDYKQCPAKAKYRHLDKLKEPESEALKRGSAIHKLLESHLKSESTVDELDLRKIREFLAVIQQDRKKHSIFDVEESWGFTSDWSPVRWDDWNNCKIRLKVDLVRQFDTNELEVIDWKTGKFRAESASDYLEQIELYALGTLIMYPGALVTPKIVYVDSGLTYPDDDKLLTYAGEDTLNDLKRSWDARTRDMLNDEVFAPKANALCRWCAYRREIGGPCIF